MQSSKLLAEYSSRSEQDTNSIGAKIFAVLQWPACVYLRGELGAGKTTLCQSLIAAAGYSGVVTSPTYNLIQEYPIAAPLVPSQNSAKEGRSLNRLEGLKKTIYHMDLYRLNDPQELYYLGLPDLWQKGSLFLIEWPEKGNGILQNPDYVVEITKNLCETEEIRKISIYQTF